MMIFFEHQTDDSYEVYVGDYVTNCPADEVGHAVVMLYQCCTEELAERAYADMTNNLWQWADQPDTMDVSK